MDDELVDVCTGEVVGAGLDNMVREIIAGAVEKEESCNKLGSAIHGKMFPING